MATYYMRADGQATSKAAATGPSTNIDACMRVVTSGSYIGHNSQTFSAGDTIYISDQGGTYTRTVAPNGIIPPSDGSGGDNWSGYNPITYAAVPGETPRIDLSWNKYAIGTHGGVDENTVGVTGSGTLWTTFSGNPNVYMTDTDLAYYGRVLWEDGIPLKGLNQVDNPATMTAGQWLYNPQLYGTPARLYYYPTTGTPAIHNLKTEWFENDNSPFGFDLRNRSNIEVSGLTFNYCGIGHASITGNTQNIKIHHNTINYFYWAIWGQLVNNLIEQDVEIYNNTINYCNSGISIWVGNVGGNLDTSHK